MAAAVVSHRSDVAARTTRSPILPPTWASSRVRVNPGCVARPEDAAARDAKRRHRHDEEWSRSSPGVKRRRRDDARGVSPDRKRKRESVDNGRRVSSSRNAYRRMRPASSAARGSDADARRHADAHRSAKNQDSERPQEARRRRSSPRSEPSPRARPDPCGAAQQQQLPAAIVAIPRVATLDGWPLQECTEQFEEAEWRRREEARREMNKVVKTVYFNDPFLSPLDVFKR